MARWARPDPSNINQRRKWNLEGKLSCSSDTFL